MSDNLQAFRNDVLFDLLTTGPVPSLKWSAHAKQRVAEMAAQGLPVAELANLAGERYPASRGRNHGDPLVRVGQFTAALTITAEGVVLVTTVLPRTAKAWARVYGSGLVADGRAIRTGTER